MFFALTFFDFLLKTFKLGAGEKVLHFLGFNCLKSVFFYDSVNLQVYTLKLFTELTILSAHLMKAICEDISFLNSILAAAVNQNRKISKHATLLLTILSIKSDKNTATILLNNGILQLFYNQTKKQQKKIIISQIIEACISLIEVYEFEGEKMIQNLVVESILNTGLCQKLEMVCNFWDENRVERITELKSLCNFIE